MSTDIQSGEDRRKHLDFAQSIVTRMSAASSSSKSLLLPVVTATYGYGIAEQSEGVALLGVCASFIFMHLDANYLKQERRFRAIYNAVAAGSGVPNFSLNYADIASKDACATKERQASNILDSWIPDKSIWLSWSIAPFYGALSAVGILIAAWGCLRGA